MHHLRKRIRVSAILSPTESDASEYQTNQQFKQFGAPENSDDLGNCGTERSGGSPGALVRSHRHEYRCTNCRSLEGRGKGQAVMEPSSKNRLGSSNNGNHHDLLS